MDTWATSSLTPQIVCRMARRSGAVRAGVPDGCAPAGARHHPHVAVLRRCCAPHLEHDSLPWTNAAISGWVLDPDRKKMSKSKGNVVTPMALLEEHGSDGVRYWAASGRPGTDTAFDPGQMKVGRRLAIKLLNAAKFALMQAEPRGPITEPLDRGMLTKLAALVARRPTELEAYDYARVLERTETLLLGLLRRLSRAGEVAPLRRLRRRSGGVGRQRHARRAVGAAAAVCAVPAVCDRGSVVVVAAGSRASRTWPTADEVVDRCGGGEDAGGAGLQRRTAALGEIRRVKAREEEADEGAVSSAGVASTSSR